MKRTLLLAVLALALSGAAVAEDEKEAPLSPRQLGELAARLQPAMMRVHFFLQQDKGEAPTGGLPCPNCGGYHGGADSYIEEERPVESAGYLVSPTEVVTFDPLIPPRFINRVEVAHGEATVDARAATYYTDRQAILLRLSRPIEGAAPLRFQPEAEGPYFSVRYTHDDGQWLARVSPFSLAEIERMEDGRLFHTAGGREIVCDREGTPVAVSMRRRWRVDEDWKLPVAEWEGMSADAVDARLAALDSRLGNEIVRVHLAFRSPRTEAAPHGYMGRYQGDEDEEATEMNVPGVIVGPERVLVLASLRPKLTARLERIVVHPSEGGPVNAAFRHSLRDHGALIAELESPLAGGVPLAEAAIEGLRDEMLLAASVRMHGETRVARMSRARIAGFRTGWRNRAFPHVAGDDEGVFLFDREGGLLAIPLERRPSAALRDRWRYGYDRGGLTPMAHLAEALRDPAAHADASNVPLSEEDEARLAWLGVELQNLTPDLARAQKVSHLTRDGEFGAIVSYVYPGSPAEEAGVEPGWALLRLHVEGEPKPLEIRIEEGFAGSFQWEMLDRIPEEYYKNLPAPWPSAENSFIRALTDIGFGKKYSAEFHRDGETALKEFTIVVGPDHYGMATRFKSEPLGLTVRDLTYEVRRYYRKGADDPGVIVSKIEEGSKASVSGLKPYEIIVAVNDQPVASAAEFEKRIEGQSELRLAVERMARSRIVQIRLDE